MGKNTDLSRLKKLRKQATFQDILKKLSLNLDLTKAEKEYVLSCAILFFKLYNQDSRNKNYFRIGYYIILKYGIRFQDYKPLYEISLQLGFYPIIDLLTNKKEKLHIVDSKNLIVDSLIFISYQKFYKSSDNYYESSEQNTSRKAILNSPSDEIAYIAPTSYGKSSLIKEFIKTNKYSRIAIIVPTKSLLIQTYQDIRNINPDYKLLLHDEMYNYEKKFIGILTQERATRLLNKYEINFDIVFIDEAHKIFNRDLRSYMLSRLIQINFKRNKNQKLVYLSPLVEADSSLKVKNTSQGLIYTKRIQHDFRTFDLYYYNQNDSYLYNRFTDEYYPLEGTYEYFEYILRHSKLKNFIFHSRPQKVEKLAKCLAENLDIDISNNSDLKEVLNWNIHP